MKRKMTTVVHLWRHAIRRPAVVDLSQTASTTSSSSFCLSSSSCSLSSSLASSSSPFIDSSSFSPSSSSLVCLHHSLPLLLVTLSLPLPPPLSLPLFPLALTPFLPPPSSLPAACLSLCFHCWAPKRLLPVLPNRWTSSRPLVPLDIRRFYLPRFYCCVEGKKGNCSLPRETNLRFSSLHFWEYERQRRWALVVEK